MKWQERNQQTLNRGLRLIRRVPFSRAVMLTGSLAEGRATEKSDIDFFVQVERGHIWLTRLLITSYLEAAGLRRTDSDITGKICLNWFATHNAPAQQARRVYQVLWQEEKPAPLKSFFEYLISSFWFNWLEKVAKNYQIKRIEYDPRTHAEGSHVRYSDEELGFHPPKITSNRSNVKST